jgi:hypothetical protein
MASLKFKIRASNGTYMKDGEEKRRYMEIGAVFENNGRLSGKLESIPVGWDGHFFLNVPDDKPQQRSGGQQQRNTGESGGIPSEPGEQIPF